MKGTWSIDPTTLRWQIVKRLRIDFERVRIDTGSPRLCPYALIHVDRLTMAEEREVTKLIREMLPTGQDYLIEIAGGEKPLFLLQESVLKPKPENAETTIHPACPKWLGEQHRSAQKVPQLLRPLAEPDQTSMTDTSATRAGTWAWAKKKMNEGFWMRRKVWPKEKGKIKRSITSLQNSSGREYVQKMPTGHLYSYAPDSSDASCNDWIVVSKGARPSEAKE